MSDDDIPVLTNVVRRERRAELTLTADRRQDIMDEVTVATSEALTSMLDETAEHVRAVLFEQLQLRLTDTLPAIIESVIQSQLDKLHADADKDDTD
ncbi:MAG: hypothetical protein AAAFM81_01660 [Pseudomonadota bacterium]